MQHTFRSLIDWHPSSSYIIFTLGPVSSFIHHIHIIYCMFHMLSMYFQVTFQARNMNESRSLGRIGCRDEGQIEICNDASWIRYPYVTHLGVSWFSILGAICRIYLYICKLYYSICLFILFQYWNRDALLCFLNVGTSLVDTRKASWPLETLRMRILVRSTRCTCSNHDGYDCGNLPSNEDHQSCNGSLNEEHSSCAKSGLPEIVQVNSPIWKANILFLLPLWLTDCICAKLQGYSRFEGPSCCYRCTMERDLEFMLLEKTTTKVDGNCLP